MSNKVEATFHPGTQPTTVEAGRITNDDLGRIVTARDQSGTVVTGELDYYTQSRTQTVLRLLYHRVPVEVRTEPDRKITIAGRQAA
ncbi:hypothetical protein GCM10023081_47000 [Arthrobacter ginkgonis]|uniref:Uncharacterized protein n=1 Tax=Arthrobacter ginkgonis TaxID=1630594 RepID=A0ABP7DI08_9MICC